MIPVVCFIACHGASSDHFATFVESINKEKVQVLQFSSGSATSIAKACAQAHLVITDVGDPFAIQLQRALAEHAPNARRYAYYDNPEPFVPGGYSVTAGEVIQLAHGVLFANANLVDDKTVAPEKDLRIGIGYYPTHKVDAIIKRRASEQAESRKAFFERQRLTDTGQKILVYFGGNNSEYYTNAFPAFVKIMQEAKPENSLIVLQQHPAAKKENRDAALTQETGIIVSDFASDVAQIIADACMYYQTSMAPQYVLAGIPTLQIGHKPYEDILVRNRLIKSVTTKEELIQALEDFKQTESIPKQVIEEGLGIKADWVERLESVWQAI